MAQAESGPGIGAPGTDRAVTSYGIILDLVGTGNRVLEVGCARGTLAASLSAAGNKVSAVKTEPWSADEARPHLDRLVNGAVEGLDLVEEFGAAQFDVVVFADILEHVKDPASLLRQARPLLAPGGFAVISVPNVAHASVRLALLRGRFDYEPAGLLDRTHLRFFTRASLEEMVGNSGFVTIETLHTTVGGFDTELELDRRDFDPDVVAAIEADAESWAYEYVIRAEPVEPSSASLAMALAARNRDVLDLRRSLAEIAGAAGPGDSGPVVGIIDCGGDLIPALVSLRLAVAALEVRRRLAGYKVRLYTLDGRSLPGFGDEVIEPLHPWSLERAGSLRRELDSVILLDGPDGDRRAEVRTALEATGLGCHHQAGGAAPVDSLVLTRRLVPADVAAARLPYLRLTGQVPEGSHYDLRLDGAELPDGGAVRGRDVVPAAAVTVMDLIGLVASASRVQTTSGPVVALAHSYSRPASASWPAPGGAGSRSRPGEQLDSLTSEADRDFDELCTRVMSDGSHRLPEMVAEQTSRLKRRVALLESTNAGLRRALGRERAVLAGQLEGGLAGDTEEPEGPWTMVTVRRLMVELHDATIERDRLRDELDQLYNTRVMKTFAPARRMYSRLRRFIG